MIKSLSFFFFLIISQIAVAEDIFSIDISSGSENDYHSFDNIDELFDASQQNNFAANLPSYIPEVSPASIKVKLANVDATLDYGQNSSMLTFKMPACGIDKNFDGGSRGKTENELRDYLNENHDRILTCSYNGEVIDDLIEDIPPDNTPDDNEAGNSIGLSVGQYSVGNRNYNVLTLPLSYTHYFEEKGRKLKLAAPLSYIDVNGSKIYKVDLGATYTRPMNEKWTIIPAAHIGLTASDDLAIGATVVSAYVTNRYEFPYKNNHITLSNMVGALTSVNYSIGDFDSYYDVSSQVLKNGISVEHPLTYKMLGGKTSMEFSLANTQFFGDKRLIDNYTDIAVSMGTRRKVGGKDNTQDSMHLGLTYTIGKKGYKGGKINFGYQF